ncbi:multi-sensor hybrid histidine kinase [Nostoc sp. HK-01]|uniref:histidine kinase n=1 Tax=Nostoc cycadae WK-1 TaxID=1861711 RepID=A0A2H6LJ93_9NOSO|nr:PAS domain-containing hybrid sensor histidine kinase/response regulator [Nostoc cycadae]BBD60552.1 multi-sensor hybrid histidine kinase [Nostoc sp. HK-01]GBE93226.1 two-component sensor histidine kinase [Nostoc cycadae WK-1]
MKRDNAGKFVSNCDGETKQRFSVTLTATAWQLLDAEAKKQGTSRSEIIEQFARSLTQEEQPASSTDRFATLVDDFSYCKQAEDTLRQSEERLRIAQQAANAGVWDWDITTNQVTWSIEYYRLYGLDPANTQASYQNWLLSIIEPDRDRTDQAARQALAHRTDLNAEFRILHPTQGERWLTAIGQTFYDDNNQPIRMTGIALDITERKLSEAALLESEKRYRYLAESIPQLVWTADTKGVLIDVNQRWCSFTGLTLTQAQTEGWQAVVHPDDAPRLGENWAVAQQDGTYYQAEGRMRRADGMYRWHLHQAVPLKNERGQVIKWFGTATDIEDQKQLEQQRIQLLQQEQAAREQAETTNRIKDEFLAVLSHELRTPLNPILGWAQLLQSQKLDPAKTREALKTIERNAKLQAQLIEDLLDVSRILQGNLSLNVSPVDLTLVIKGAVETVRLAAQAKSITIKTILTSNVGQVAGDSTRLQQVVWNLLSNALKFTQLGGLVEVRLECFDSVAQITVSDNGKGISPEFLPFIFDYFRQADSATTRKFGGLGLGLAIVRHLIELHGGTVQAQSLGEGLGAIFTVRLPLMPVQSQINQHSQQVKPVLNLNGIKVLVVDDDFDNCEFVTFVLEQEGANVVMASSAKEALTVLSHFPADILLSDIGMPQVDGYMLMQQVKNLPPAQGGNIKAIALSAYAGEINEKQAINAGFHRHISKPVEPEELITAIVELVD